MKATRYILPSAGLASLAITCVVLLPSAQSQGDAHSIFTTCYQPNRLGNGGFESWPNGANGSIPPGGWVVMGDPANTFADHGFMTITRVMGEAFCPRKIGGGKWAVELTPLQTGNYISQKIENWEEYRCKTVSFSARFKSDAVANPKITVDDGVGESFDTRNLVIGNWRYLTVTHTVAENATKLELEIDPGGITIVDEAQLVLGEQARAPYVPRPNSEPGLMQLPMGSVIDWYRPDVNMPVPEGFVIADGSVVADVESPFFGKATPDLADRFVRGVTDVAAIGSTGGVESNDVGHTHPIPHTHSVPLLSPYAWVGNITIGPQCVQRGNYNTGGPSSSDSGYALDVIDNKPPYVGLLKIMRVK